MARLLRLLGVVCLSLAALGCNARDAASQGGVGSAPTRQLAADEIAPAQLPKEGREVLALIRAGGPFRYERDGVVFGNFEKRLPRQARGYYREYTVPTPGARNRGARRIVAGGQPPTVFYYTDDHYETFRRIVE